MRTTEGTHVWDMGAYLHQKSLDTSWLDDECGSVDESGWFGRIGRHIISVSTTGIRYHSAFPTVALAEAQMVRLHEECEAEKDYEDCDCHECVTYADVIGAMIEMGGTK